MNLLFFLPLAILSQSSMIESSLLGTRLVSRVGFLLELGNNRAILHLGATDAPDTKLAIESGRLLHNQLSNVAKRIVGMDNNAEMISLLFDKYGVDSIVFGDIEIRSDYPEGDFDVIVAGEIMEHLSNPGRALDALRASLAPQGVLVITVPNAYSFKGFLRALFGYELIHQDHVLHHSLHTLRSLLQRHGYEIEKTVNYVNGGRSPLAAIANKLLKFFPRLAEGVAVVCRASNGGPKLLT